jgi:hypothetical protein
VCQTPREKPEKREWGIFEMSPPCVKRINKESGEIECMYLPLDVVEERMKYDGMAKYIKARDEEPTLKQKIYYFLYGIEYLWNNAKISTETEDDRKYRKHEIMEFYKDKGTRKRMEGILNFTEDNCSNDEDAVAFWEENQSLVLRYNAQPNTASFLKKREIGYVAHRQTSIDCYMLASGRHLGYEYCIDNYDDRVAMGNDAHLETITVDLAKLIRHHLHGDALKKRARDNKGGSPQEILESLIEGCDDLMIETICLRKASALNDIAKTLPNHPILIQHFITNNHFRRARKLQCSRGQIVRFDIDPETGEDTSEIITLSDPAPGEREFIQRVATANGISLPDNDAPSLEPVSSDSDSGSEREHQLDDGDDRDDAKKEGSHSLLMISNRYELQACGERKDWYLIQNSWKDLQLFEASRAYLIKHLSRGKSMVPLIHLDGPGRCVLPETIMAHCSVFVSSDYDDGGDEMEEDLEDVES